MKKIISFVLAALLLVSAVPMAHATNDYTAGTAVVYTATNTEAYTVTVPAQLAPGGSGTVTLEGTWADNRVVTVTADPTVTLTNSIKAEDQKVLNVNFDGISEAGSNTTRQTFTEDVSVANIENALFGTWSGKFNYNVDVTSTLTTDTASGSYIFIDNVASTQHNLTVNLSSDTISDFSGVNVSRYGSNLLDMSKLLKDNLLVDNGDGTYIFTRTALGNSGIYTNYQDIFIPKGTTLYMSVTTIENNLTHGAFYAAFRFEDGTRQLIPLYTTARGQTFDKDIIGIAMMCSDTNNEVGDTYIFSEPQLNIGSKLEYQDYIDVQTVTANADGSVVGLTSISPNMTIITNNSDVEITCEYQKKN